MQMGFDHYLDLLHEQPGLFARLMSINEEFCVSWANAQLMAGASMIIYYDPVSSPTIIPRDLYLRTGYPIACRTIKRIQGATTTHFASGRCIPILEDVMKTGTVMISASISEDLTKIKTFCKDKLSIIGNLNGIEMRRWVPSQVETIVKDAISKGGAGGGFILSDNHGEIPYQVSDEILLEISAAVHRWGNYPLKWIETHGE